VVASLFSHGVTDVLRSDRTFITEFPLAQALMRSADAVSPLRGAMLRAGLIGTSPVGWGNLLLIGEAIGATLPFTGEGIGKAMETAKLAADIVHHVLTSSGCRYVMEFPRRLATKFGPRFRAYRVVEEWLSKPWVNDFAISRARRGRFVRESFASILNETVDPRAIFSLRGIIHAFLR
jgi:menaquinone-9 beta-reductase